MATFTCCPFRRLWGESGSSGLAYGYIYSGRHSVLNALLFPLPTLNWPFSLYKDGVHTDHFFLYQNGVQTDHSLYKIGTHTDPSLCIKMQSRLTTLCINMESRLTILPLYINMESGLTILSIPTWSPDWPLCLYHNGAQTDPKGAERDSAGNS